MSSNLMGSTADIHIKPQDAAVLRDLGKHIPGDHGVTDLKTLDPRLSGSRPLDGPSQQAKLVASAKQHHHAVLEARAQVRDQNYHPGRASDLLQGRISDQHSDEANVDGVRNIN